MAQKSFESALARLEKITEELENGDLSLEASLKKFDEGIKLTEFCNADLEGKRVGTRYEMTANVWARALLADEYGVELEKIRWVHQTGGADGARFKLPPEVGIQTVERDVDLLDWLVAGKIDALIHPDLLPLRVLEHAHVRRLFADAAAEERKSYARTKIVPVMNVVIFRRGEESTTIKRVFDAFVRAKNAGIAAMLISGANASNS